MSFNGSGTFLINTAGQPVVAGTVISSTAFNALTADLATGLSTVITKDGQTTVTANIPMSTYKFTGLGVGSAATDSANLSQVQSTVTKLLTSVSGTDTITAVGAPVVAAYAAGQMFYFVATGDNTGAVTLNIDSLGAKAVTRDGSVALVAGDIKSGEVVVVVYDGTRFQVVSQLNSAGDARFANVSIASSLYVGGVSTFVGNAGFSANVSIASALSVGGVAAITGATTIGGNLTLNGGTANGVLYLNGSKVATSGTALVFDGTNLGIGTSSPGSKLHVATLTSETAVQVTNNNATVYLGAVYASNNFANGTVAGQGIVRSGAGIAFSANGGTSVQALLDSSGNLGLGVTPSAWSIRALQVGSGFAAWSTAVTNARIFANTYYDGAYKYVGTGRATQYEQDGYHAWYTSASGTAGNAISFTQAMTLDASGNLQLGTTTNKTTAFSGNGTGMTIGASLAPMIALWDTSAATNVATLGQIDADTYLTNSANGLMVFSTNNTERARITSGGNFMLTSGGQIELNVSTLSSKGAISAFNTDSISGGLVFKTEASSTLAERARITAGGYSKFSNNGTYVSSTGAYHEFHSSDAAQPILYLTATSGSYTGQTIYINNTRAASSAYKFYSANANAVEQFYVRGDGVLYAQNTTIQSLSDGRLKENIRNATEGLDVINALRPIRYDWKTGFGNDRKNQLGFVAQEVEAVFPDAVSEWSKTEGDEEAYKTVGPGALIPVLVKAIQELTARVAQLESK